ncbi:MAG: DUF72 domain-containing protein [Acidimicrobiales bacterium]
MTEASALAPTQAATGVTIGGCRVLAGSSSWADRSLVRDGTFYPSRSLSAAQRLAYYASRLPLAEVATTYRFPPTPDVARRWVATTPPGFTLDLRAWSLLSGAPTWPESLWPDLQGYVKPPSRGGTKLYRHQLAGDVVDECWERFCHALRPLARAGRLGTVVVRFPGWFRPRPEAWEELATLPARLGEFRLAVELSNERWFHGDACERTLGFLEQLGLCLVCSDSLGYRRPVVAATGDVAFVRFTGRRQHAWERADGERGGERPDGNGAAAGGKGDAKGEGERGAAAEGGAEGGLHLERAAWWSYRYSEAELAAWVPAVRDLASCTSQVHLILDNCWRADAVDNAGRLLELLAGA